MTPSFAKDFPQKPIFILIAPTASGKTQLSIQMAQAYDFEIINADAYQFFTEMNIGTAKPTIKERSQAPHHLFDIKTPEQDFSAHQFATLAKEKMHDIFSRGKYPLFVGGSGFYIRALLTPDSDLPQGTLGIDDPSKMYHQVIEKDPKLTQHLHPHDTYRICRAAFLLEQGYIPSQAWEEEKKKSYPNPVHFFTIAMEREKLYQRINQRVLTMFEKGLLQETEYILQNYPASKEKLSKTIGYQQALMHMEGDLSKDEAISMTQQKTRNYAKRQLTWLKNQLDPERLDFEYAFEQFSCYMNKSNCL